MCGKGQVAGTRMRFNGGGSYRANMPPCAEECRLEAEEETHWSWSGSRAEWGELHGERDGTWNIADVQCAGSMLSNQVHNGVK